MTDSSAPNRLNEPQPPRGKGQGKISVKALAIIVALIMIVSALAVLDFYHPASIGSTVTASSVSETTTVGQTYSLNLTSNGIFSNVTVFWGDGSQITVFYSGSNKVSLTHTYQNPGNYLIYYTMNFGNKVVSNSNSLIPVTVGQTNLSSDSAVGLLAVSPSSSSKPLHNITNLYSPGSSLQLVLGYHTEPSNTNYLIIAQTLDVMHNSSQISHYYLPYLYNASAGLFTVSQSASLYNLTNIGTGIYELGIKTYTGEPFSNSGVVNFSAGVHSTVLYIDLGVFSNANLYNQTSSSTLVHTELAEGGYVNLDPALAEDAVSDEIQMNTMQSLVYYNGSNENSFIPMLTSALPSTINGGINTKDSNYTVTDPWGSSYTVKVLPYENYTFHIRANATWQNGQPVTAWDVLYSFARVLVYDAEPVNGPGYIFAPYLLPGNYYATNTFWNITQNITVNNKTNNVTFHFQVPLQPSFVFQILSGPGGYIMDPQWLQANGDGMNWSSSGFQAYKSTGLPQNWNTYVQTHTFSDGPYMIAYQIEGTEVVLQANPNFNPPGSWFPKASVKNVVIEYVSSTSTIYLDFESGASQISTVPNTLFNAVQSLQKNGKANIYVFPTLVLDMADFNANVDTSMLSTLVPSANMPGPLFSSELVRKVFAYAFNYSEYLSTSVNFLPNVTFGTPDAGLLVQGLTPSENASQLNKTTGGNVPYFSLAMAKMYWNEFMKTQASSVGITNSSSGPLYNGKPLNIPIIIQLGDTADIDFDPTWISALQQIIPNLHSEEDVISVDQLIGYLVEGADPMPIWEGPWTPAFPNAAGNLGPLGYPNNSSLTMAADTMVPFWFNTPSNPLSNTSEYQNMTKLSELYNEAVTATNFTKQSEEYLQMNAIIVNMTLYVYLYQETATWITSPSISATSMMNYQLNPVMNSYNVMYYNWVKMS